MNDFETHLAQTLRERADTARIDDRLDDVLHGTNAQSSSAPVRWRWLAAAAAVLLVVGGVWALSRRSTNDTVTVPDATSTSMAADPNAIAWQPFAPPPLSARSANLSVSTGDGWFVWGGYTPTDVDPNRPPFDDGAYLDAATGEWRTLPPAPFTSVNGNTGRAVDALWTGSEVMVVQSDGGLQVVAFDPVAFTWRTIDVPADIVAAWPTTNGIPHPGIYQYVAGRVVFFLRPDPAETGQRPLVLLLDPATDEWTVGATPPAAMAGAWWSPVAASATDLFVLDASRVKSDGTCPGSTPLFAYDVQADAWRDEPPAELNWQPAIVAWTGDRLLLAGGSACNGSAPLVAVRATALFDPVAGTWTAGADLPVDVGELRDDPVVLGDMVVAVAADVRPLVYDPGTDQWWQGPSPLAEGVQADSTPVVVAGQVRMWSPGIWRPDSSGSSCCYPTGEAYTLTVPAPERWREVEVATIPTLEPTTTLFTGETMALPTPTAVASSTP
ncbi:MAG: hypothetical protein Q7T27_06430 [Pseudomonas sp.]|uniref:hypothetical protein n=1 Tax=Pseudomonas sp. TaxID=306 RepID=UPI00271A845D|nr:hypothetical protein [Pseudomonas sp.]MDO8403115.1 hypothetical protein [Pseudomonas sp.]